MSVPNQLIINIQKKDNYDTQNNEFFYLAGVDSTINAMKNLSPSGIKLFLYFLLWKNNSNFELSFIHVKERTGLSESSYHRAINELKEKGYLIHQYNFNYIFNENPRV